MSYGYTYSEIKQEKSKPQVESLVHLLCKQCGGYEREHLDGVELESKINIKFVRPKRISFWNTMLNGDINNYLNQGNIIETEKIVGHLKLPEPYSFDLVLNQSSSLHSCYGFGRRSELDRMTYAFTKVEDNQGLKIKIKGVPIEEKHGEIVLLKRQEEHLRNLSIIDMMKKISEMSQEKQLPLEYLGSFGKNDYDYSIFNPTSGRIFVIANNICSVPNTNHSLQQVEIEYYGRVMHYGFNSSKSPEEDVAELTKGVIHSLSSLRGYFAESTTLTKFDWLKSCLGGR